MVKMLLNANTRLPGFQEEPYKLFDSKDTKDFVFRFQIPKIRAYMDTIVFRLKARE
jgi:hypothetical protein